MIPHQTVLANVELALTISGISRKERKSRAKKALEEVGLGNQIHKKPNQMSGGQMQRVAIARALVNNPDILLADEPTGALDTETSIQVMELLKEVAKKRLVVMVTHNPELAETYATRIVRVTDGKIIDDSDPYEIESTEQKAPEHKNMGKSSMSFLTSLALSFNNLRTKKGRTLLTSFAGSIGIIGIALILSLSNGVNTYIENIQKSTMTSYPITIEEQSIDLTSMLDAGKQNTDGSSEVFHELDGVYVNGSDIELASTMTASVTENNLTAFKKYLDDDSSAIHDYIGENGIVYSYATKFSVYTHDSEGTLVNTDGSTLTDNNSDSMQSSVGGMSMMSMDSSSDSNNFEELMPGTDENAISAAVTENYEVLYGDFPAEYNQAVLVLDENNEVSATALYELGLLPSSEYQNLMEQIDNGEEVTVDTQKLSYEDICSQSFYLIPACDTYEKQADGTYASIIEDDSKIESLLDDALEIQICGVIRPKKDADYTGITSAVGYTKALTDYLIEYTNNSEIVKAQEENPDTNILSGVSFAPADDAAKIEDAKTYLSGLGVTEKAELCRNILGQTASEDPETVAQMETMSETELAQQLDEYLKDPEEEVLLQIYDSYISPGSYEDNMKAFGVVSLDAPSAINLYADSFEDKDAISDCITNYNNTVSEENQITYTDYVGMLMSSVTTIVNVISYVLIAFVAVSLVVSSIMIGIITFISVLERTKEIGILRAIGASKRNISQVFNAETFIIGLCSGVLGIGITELLLIPANVVIHSLTGSDAVNAALPITSAGILILLSVILTLIGGFIPAKKAAKKDPVTALRTE